MPGPSTPRSSLAIATLNRYNAAREVWRQMATDTLEFEEQRRLRDSLAYALHVELEALRQEFTDSTDRALLGTVLMDLDTARRRRSCVWVSRAGRRSSSSPPGRTRPCWLRRPRASGPAWWARC